jgi:hypothetical protein
MSGIVASPRTAPATQQSSFPRLFDSITLRLNWLYRLESE